MNNNNAGLEILVELYLNLFWSIITSYDLNIGDITLLFYNTELNIAIN